MKTHTNNLHILLMAAGSGKRFEASLPTIYQTSPNPLSKGNLSEVGLSKVYWQWRGKTLLEYVYDRWISFGIPASQIHVVVAPDKREHQHNLTIPKEAFLEGGDTRQESVFLALKSLEKNSLEKNSLEKKIHAQHPHAQHPHAQHLHAQHLHAQPKEVCVHDVARPEVSKELLERILSKRNLNQEQCVVPVLPVVDTLVKIKNHEEPSHVLRDNLYHVQTPQMFPFQALLQAHRMMQGQQHTDDAQMMHKNGYKITFVEGALENMKITSYQDYLFLKRTSPPFSVYGYDTHRFGTKGTLTLGGLRLPGYCALEGHSDGDVLLHALCDAILSACGTDIGTVFPSSDPQWKNAPSTIFIHDAIKRLKAKHLTILHADITMIGKTPPISKHKSNLLESLSQCLSLSKEHITFKARSGNHVGETGAGKALTASCILTLQ